MTKPLSLGTIVEPWGEIAMVGSGGGVFSERYYWLVDDMGGVSMMPADVIERAASAERTEP